MIKIKVQKLKSNRSNNNSEKNSFKLKILQNNRMNGGGEGTSILKNLYQG